MAELGTAERGGGFSQGVDPRQQQRAAEEWQRANAQQAGGTGPPITIVNQQPSGNGRVFTEAEVAQIRAEEKEKLYGRMSEMEQQLQTLAEERAAREAAEQAAAEAAEAAERARLEAETDVRTLLTQRETEWEQRFRTLEEDRERERVLREQEMHYSALLEYKRNRMEQEVGAGTIMPELRDLIFGNTEEEVEASILAMRERTAAIVANVQGAVTQQRQQIRGASITAPPVGPMEQQTTLETMTVDDLRNMDQGTYAKNRDRLMEAARAARRTS